MLNSNQKITNTISRNTITVIGWCKLSGQSQLKPTLPKIESLLVEDFYANTKKEAAQECLKMLLIDQGPWLTDYKLAFAFENKNNDYTWVILDSVNQ